MQIVTVNFVDNTRALAEQDLNTILLIDTTQDVNFMETDTQAAIVGVAPAGVAITDKSYELFGHISEQKRQITCFVGIDSAVPGDITIGLNALDNSKFFYVVSDTLDLIVAEEIKDWCVANEKMFMWTPDMLELDATVFTAADNWNTELAAMFMHPGTKPNPTAVPPIAAEDYNLAVGATGKCAPYAPGSITWAHKIVNGMPANVFNPTRQATIEATDRINWPQFVMGMYPILDGITTAKTYIDITVSKFWLKAKLELALTQLFINNGKVPFTTNGKALIKNAIDGVIDQAINQGILAPGETVVNVPDPLSLPMNDRANRKWTNIEITARLQGAVHQAEVLFVLNV